MGPKKNKRRCIKRVNVITSPGRDFSDEGVDTSIIESGSQFFRVPLESGCLSPITNTNLRRLTMGRKTLISLLVMVLCLAWGFSMTAMAQSPVRDPAKFWNRPEFFPLQLKDTEKIKAEMEKARQLAGDDWYFLQTQRLQCSDVDESNTVVMPPGPNGTPGGGGSTGFKEAPAVPTKVFDNVYYVGGWEVGGWLIDTGKGYIMLDSSYDYGVQSILVPNMAKLGLDPAKVKYMMITHGGIGAKSGDHSGGVKYFNANYGTKVVLSAPEWAKSDQTYINPDDVIVPTDGQTLTLGNTTVTMVNTPRSVGGGGLSYFISVKIQGKRHLWATYGNTGIGAPLANIQVYLDSMAKWFTYVDKLKPDIAISSHPFVDGSIRRMEIIRECDDRDGHHGFFRHDQCGPHNPFLLGREGARRYFEIMNQCAVVRYEREKAGLARDGLGTPDFQW
jgi:metallo-beta-lactamase class B